MKAALKRTLVIAQLALLAVLTSCGVPLVEPAGALLAASAAAVPVFGRSLPDMLYSGVTGRDCSIVRLDQGKSYCRPPDPPLTPAPTCTRSLANVDCWTNPEVFGTLPHTIADSLAATPQQEAYRTRRWPDF